MGTKDNRYVPQPLVDKLAGAGVHFVQEWEGGAWECSRCALVWYFECGGSPAENNMHYCPQCGGVILLERPWTGQAENE